MIKFKWVIGNWYVASYILRDRLKDGWIRSIYVCKLPINEVIDWSLLCVVF